MAVLDQLTLSNATPKRDTSPTGRFRRRLLDAIDLQVAMAEAEAKGTAFTPTRTRRVKNEAGVKEPRTVPIRVRPWWWKGDAGTFHLSPHHGGRILEIAPGKTSIEVGAFADLPGKLAILRDAVRAGELDGCMAEARPPRTQEATKGEQVAKRGPRKATEGGRPAAA